MAYLSGKINYMKKKTFTAFLILSFLLGGVIILPILPDFRPDLQSEFQKAIVGCDRIVFRDGGYETGYGSEQVLLALESPKDIDQFIKSMKFKLFQEHVRCACYGWPAIEFYKREEKILRISSQHNKMLRVPFANHDLSLKNSSSTYLDELTKTLRSTTILEPSTRSLEPGN